MTIYLRAPNGHIAGSTDGNPKYPIVFKDRKITDPKEYMRCPECGHLMSRVMSTSAAQFDGLNGVGRSRRCLGCDHTWRTIELKIEELDEYE